MKYIIEIEDEPCMYECGMKFYQCKNVPCWSVSDRIISNLEPYAEPDRQAVEDEVWELVRIITDMTEKQREECFGKSTCDLDEYLTYQEAKAKYNEWLKQRDEIHVGDEVKDADGNKGIVLDGCVRDGFHIFDEDGEVRLLFVEFAHKTARHFTEIEKLLEEMRE